MKNIVKPFIEWEESGKNGAEEYNRLRLKTCLNDRTKVVMASRYAFKAGKEEGIRIMKNKLTKLIKEN